MVVRLALAVAAVLAGVSIAAASTAGAEEPTETVTSTSDELADMVMAVIEEGAIPTPALPEVPPQ